MAFATAAQLATRLGRTFTPEQVTQADELLEDATEYLRGIIGSHVAPQRTSTVTLHPSEVDTFLELPGPPIMSVQVVEINGQPFTGWVLRDGLLHHPRGWRGRIASDVITVTYTHGYPAAPADLVALTCVLAAEALANIKDLKQLAPGSVSNVRVGDYGKGWHTRGGGLPAHIVDDLRARYGRSAVVTGWRR